MTPDEIRMSFAVSHRNAARNAALFCERRLKAAERYRDLAHSAEDVNQPDNAADYAQEVRDAYACALVFEDKARNALSHVHGFANQIEGQRMNKRACKVRDQARKHANNAQKTVTSFSTVVADIAHIPTLHPSGTEADPDW